MNILSVALNYLKVNVKRDLRYHLALMLKRRKISNEYLKAYQDFRTRYKGTSSMFWNKTAEGMKKEFVINGLDNFRQGYLGQAFRKINDEKKTKDYYQYVKSIDRFGILEKVIESLAGNPPNYVVVGDKFITGDFLQSIEEFYDIIELTGWKPDRKTTVCEIGGGYGRLAYVFLKMMPNLKYVFVDLPETLILAYYFMKENGLNDRCVFLTPNEVSEVKPELWVNIDSFQEMTYEIIGDYFKVISKMGKYVYLKEFENNYNFKDGISINIHKYPFTKNMTIENEKVWNRTCGIFNQKKKDYVIMFMKIKKKGSA